MNADLNFVMLRKRERQTSNWRTRMTLLTSLVLAVFSTVAIGQQTKLEGRLITDTGEPVANTKVRMEGGQSARTDAEGKFSISLDSKLRAGDRITILVEKKGWLINQPLDGEWIMPSTVTQSLEVIVVPFGSKALWTNARIEKELKQRSEVRGKDSDSDGYIEELARKFGSTLQATKEAFDKWATTQNDTGNALKEQASRVDGAEGVRLLSEAVSAYQRSSLVFTRDDRPQEWATAQHNIGNALQDEGARAKGAESIRLFGEAAAAYRRALTIRTREQLPRQWATTLNDLGNALQGQGTRAEGAEARRLLGEAADAYGQALLFFTRGYTPQEWAMIQHNLGSALHERGTRTEGPEALKLLGDAVTAYRQALVIRTREQLPQQWAVTQNNLGNALQAQGTRAEKSDAVRLLHESTDAYRLALLVFTREQRPQLWAMTKHNLGSALQEEGIKSEGTEAQRLLQEAVAAYGEALLVWTRPQRPQQWAMAQNNLARAYSNLQDWTSAAKCYESVLSDDRVDVRIKISLLPMEIANLIALKRTAEVPARMKNLIELLEAQPADFKLQSAFEGTRHFINRNQQFDANKTWLLKLLEAMDGENRDAIVRELKVAAESFTPK